MWHDMSRKLALMFIPMVALLLLNAHNIIVLLFTERYVRSVPIFMVWSLAILFATYCRPMPCCACSHKPAFC